MISREPNSRPAIVSLHIDEPLARRASNSATLHRRHHFHPRAVGQRGFPFRSGQHGPVDSDRDALLRKAEAFHQRRDGRLLIDLHGFVVDCHFHRPAPTVTFSSAAIRSAVHGASKNPLRPCPAATSVRSSSRSTNGSPSGVIGRKPAAHSASSYSPSGGITAHASSNSSRTPVTAGAVSRPCSYWVAPTTTPSARGTRYTWRPCTRARITRCGTGIQPRRQRSRNTSPFTGRIGSPGHNVGASMPLAMTTVSPWASDSASTGGAH